MKRLIFIFAFLIGSLISFAQGKKVAFLVGNSEYTGRFTKLHTPSNDVDAMNHMLQILGYETIVAKDVSTNQSMSQNLAKFKEKANGAEIALFYFSGHGGTIEKKYYLVPSGHIDSKATLSDVCFSFRSVENIMEGTRAKTKIYFIDACRNALDGITKGRVYGGGQDVVNSWGNEVGSLKCYATSENKEVEVKGEDKYSVFTNAIVNHIADDTTFDQVWKRISNDVYQQAPGQTPFISVSPKGTNIMEKLRLNPNKIDVYPYWNRIGFARVIFNVAQNGAVIKVNTKPENKYSKPEVKEYKSGEFVPMKFGTTYEYEISLYGYEKFKNTITLSPNSRTRYNISLTKLDDATIRISSNVRGSSITFDGRYIGRTPYTHTTLSGAHDIKIEHNNYESYTASPILKSGYNSLYAELHRDWPWFLEKPDDGLYLINYHYSPKYQIGLSFMYRPELSVFSFGGYLSSSTDVFAQLSKSTSYTQTTTIDLETIINGSGSSGETNKDIVEIIDGTNQPYSSFVDPNNEAKHYDVNFMILANGGYHPCNGIMIELGAGAAYHQDKWYMEQPYSIKKTIKADPITGEYGEPEYSYNHNGSSHWYKDGAKWSFAVRLGTRFMIPLDYRQDNMLTIGAGYSYLPMNHSYSCWDATIGYAWTF